MKTCLTAMALQLATVAAGAQTVCTPRVTLRSIGPVFPHEPPTPRLRRRKAVNGPAHRHTKEPPQRRAHIGTKSQSAFSGIEIDRYRCNPAVQGMRPASDWVLPIGFGC